MSPLKRLRQLLRGLVVLIRRLHVGVGDQQRGASGLVSATGASPYGTIVQNPMNQTSF
jgi:hypothetical protein